jgi:hypothetical protein
MNDYRFFPVYAFGILPRPQRLDVRDHQFLCEIEPPNIGVEAAARIHSSIAGPVMMRNTLPPLASNDLLGLRLES